MQINKMTESSVDLSVGKEETTDGMLVLSRNANASSVFGGSVSTRSSTPVSRQVANLQLPECMFPSYRTAIEVCVDVVASGRYSGFEFAELLQRAEVYCELAAEISRVGLQHADMTEVFLTSAIEVDKRFGWKTSFVADVADLAVVVGVTTEGGLRRVDELSSAVRAVLDLKVVGDNVAVAKLRADGGVSVVQSSHDDFNVIPYPVYKRLIRVGTKVMGSTVLVSVSRTTDGIYRVEREFDCSRCYSISALPVGKYSLPGGFGRLVSRDYLATLLENTVALPALRATKGFCYLGTLPPSVRLAAAKILGAEPVVASVVRCFPEAYDWCDKDAVVKLTGYAGDIPVYHVSDGGRLPSWLGTASRVGTPDKYESETSRHAEKLLNEIFSVKNNLASSIDTRSAGFPPAPMPVLPIREEVNARQDVPRASSLRDVRVDQSDASSSAVMVHRPREVRYNMTSTPVTALAVPVRHGRSLSDSGLIMGGRVVLDTGASTVLKPVWQGVDTPRSRMWAARLSEGPPVHPSVLLDMADVKVVDKLPLPPSVVAGVAVVVNPTERCRSDGGQLISWHARKPMISGCSMEVAKLSSRKGKRFIAVHPAANVMCRYDLNFDNSVIVNGWLNVKSTASVLWLSANMALNVMGSGTVVRTWFDDGMVGLGPMVMSLTYSWSSIAVCMFGGDIHADRVIGLELSSADARSGLLRYHKRFAMGLSVEKVHLYAFDEVASEPTLLEIRAAGLRYIVVHDTRIVSEAGVASVIVLDAQTTVKICVQSDRVPANVEAEMIFVRDSVRYASVVGHRIADNSVTVGRSAMRRANAGLLEN